MKALFLVMSLLLVSVSASASIAADRDGFSFNLVSYVQASANQYNSGTFKLTLKNHCGRRVYMKFCLEMSRGSHDCGANGDRSGSSTTWSSSSPYLTQRYSYKYIGSERSSHDWVCSGKTSDWNADTF